jgi:hypothetical protein
MSDARAWRSPHSSLFSLHGLISRQWRASTNSVRCRALVVATTTSSVSGCRMVAAWAARITSASRPRSGAEGRPRWRARAQKPAAKSSRLS